MEFEDKAEALEMYAEAKEISKSDLENGDTTAAEVSVDWDNKLRKINQLARAASESIKDGNAYYQKNLINSSSRSSFTTQTLFAPYNSKGDTLQVDGVYLGTDYFITETVSGDFWNSDTAFLSSEEGVGTLTEYSSYPDTATGQSDTVTDITLNSYTSSTGAIDFDISGGTNITGTVSGGGSGELLRSGCFDRCEGRYKGSECLRQRGNC